MYVSMQQEGSQCQSQSPEEEGSVGGLEGCVCWGGVGVWVYRYPSETEGVRVCVWTFA